MEEKNQFTILGCQNWRSTSHNSQVIPTSIQFQKLWLSTKGLSTYIPVDMFPRRNRRQWQRMRGREAGKFFHLFRRAGARIALCVSERISLSSGTILVRFYTFAILLCIVVGRYFSLFFFFLFCGVIHTWLMATCFLGVGWQKYLCMCLQPLSLYDCFRGVEPSVLHILNSWSSLYPKA